MPAAQPPPFSPTVALLALSRTWEADLAELLRPLGLSIRGFGLLGHIGRAPDISFSELARRSRITVQTAHAAVAGLTAAGWVDDATAHAGAASRLRVTDDGRQLLDRAARSRADLDRRFSERHPELAAALGVEVDRATSTG